MPGKGNPRAVTVPWYSDASDALAVVIAQHRFEHDAYGDGQARDGADAVFLELRQRVILACAGGCDVEGLV